MTTLSVIIPCFNVQDYVASTVRSLRRNVAPGIEFVLVDDASTDGTAALLDRHVDALPGARVITCPENRGLAAARNTGLAAARGTHLTFLDGDDFVAPGYYSALLGTIERLGCDMVRTDHVRVRGRTRTVHRISHGPRGVVMSPRDAIVPLHRSTSVDAPNAWAGIYHRRLLDNGLLLFSEQLQTCEDRPWNWRLHLRASSFAVVGLLGVRYRRDVSTSLTQLADERQFDFLPAFDQIVADVLADREADRFLPKAVRSYLAMICHHLDRSDRYTPALAARLRALCAAAYGRLPARTVATVMAGLDERRRSILTDLDPAAAAA